MTPPTPTPLSPALQKAVDALLMAFYVKDERLDKAKALITAFTAELEQAQQERNEQSAIVDRVWRALGIVSYKQAHPLAIDEHVAKVIKERDQAQAACAQMPKVIEIAGSHDHSYGDEKDCVLCQAVNSILDRPAEICGTGFKSPAEYAALEAKLAEADACCVKRGKVLQASFDIDCYLPEAWRDAREDALLSTTCGQSLLDERERLRKALELIASNARPIGTHWDDWAPIIAREALAPTEEKK
jgi:hypothetical protein